MFEILQVENLSMGASKLNPALNTIDFDLGRFKNFQIFSRNTNARPLLKANSLAPQCGSGKFCFFVLSTVTLSSRITKMSLPDEGSTILRLTSSKLNDQISLMTSQTGVGIQGLHQRCLLFTNHVDHSRNFESFKRWGRNERWFLLVVPELSMQTFIVVRM